MANALCPPSTLASASSHPHRHILSAKACAKVFVLAFAVATLSSPLASGFLTLEDQRVRYYYTSGNMAIRDISKQVECHVFSTLYKEDGYLKLAGMLMPNEDRHQGGWQDLFLVMPHEVVKWDPELRVTLHNNSVVPVKVREWHSWSKQVNVEYCIPITFELILRSDKGSQPTTLHVADWEPMPLPQQVEEKPVGQLATVIVYSHIRGQVTSDKIELLHMHIAYHQQSGVNEFWLYATSQQIVDLRASEKLRDVLDLGTLKLIYWPDMLCTKFLDCTESTGHHYKHQILAHNVARLAGIQAHKGLLILDTDEFVVSNVTAINNIALGQEVLQSHAQAVIPRYDSFACGQGENADAVPEISFLKQDSKSFLNQVRTRSRTPHWPIKGKSMIDPGKMAVFGIHMGTPADAHETLWHSQSEVFILHLVNMWAIRVCEDDVEQVPAWNKAA